jgi:hypothetical protein
MPTAVVISYTPDYGRSYSLTRPWQKNLSLSSVRSILYGFSEKKYCTSLQFCLVVITGKFLYTGVITFPFALVTLNSKGQLTSLLV